MAEQNYTDNGIVESDDIVTRLRDLLDGPVPMTVERADVRAAVDEIERLRAQCAFAHAILASEPMLWLTGGTSNHTAGWWREITPAIHKYWEQYGSFARPATANEGEARRG